MSMPSPPSSVRCLGPSAALLTAAARTIMRWARMERGALACSRGQGMQESG